MEHQPPQPGPLPGGQGHRAPPPGLAAGGQEAARRPPDAGFSEILEPKPVEGAASPNLPPALLGSALSGSLPCIGCGYELRGLSIRSVCPECGVAVRATILYNVDPHADEFQPLYTPRLTSVCLVVWPAGAFVACLAGWAERLADIAEVLSGRPPILPAWTGTLEWFAAAASGAALLGVIRPARALPWWKSVAVLAAMAAYLPLLWCIHRANMIDAARGVPYFSSQLHLDRVGVHMLMTLCIGFILAAARPVARDLVRRSLALRMGRVDRQTLLVLVGVCGLVLVGDALRWFAGVRDEPHALAVGTLIVAAGSLFLTLGFASAIVDGWRIGRAIRTPAPGLRHLVGAE